MSTPGPANAPGSAHLWRIGYSPARCRRASKPQPASALSLMKPGRVGLIVGAGVILEGDVRLGIEAEKSDHRPTQAARPL
jgi:hypothetical protein